MLVGQSIRKCHLMYILYNKGNPAQLTGAYVVQHHNVKLSSCYGSLLPLYCRLQSYSSQIYTTSMHLNAAQAEAFLADVLMQID